MTMTAETTRTEEYTVRVDVDIDGIPRRLKVRPQWVVWRLELRDGKQTKVPYSARTGRKADSTDLMTWATFPETLEAYESGKYLGLGFMFCSGDKFIGIDLDDCRGPDCGIIEPWAVEVMESFKGADIELSPSGSGIHIIAFGRLPKTGEHQRKDDIEMYDQERFFCITGVSV